MKIAMFGHKRIPSREGGVEIVVEELCVRMAQQDHEICCYNRAGHHVSGKEFDRDARQKYRNISIKTVPTIDIKGLAAVTSSFFAALCSAFGRAEVVHIHAEGPAFMCWLPKFFGKRVVVTVHGLDWQREKWKSGFASKYIRAGERMAARYADEIVVLSRNVQQYFKSVYNRETKFIPNGVNKPQIRMAQGITEQFDLNKNGYVLFLGRLVPEKGIHYLIEAFREVHTDKKLVIAGGASDSDDYVQRLAEQSVGDDRIVFTGFVQGPLLEELYSNAYVYVLPSDVEGMPLSLLEAMSYGNCCVTSDIEECAAVIGDNGITFSKGAVNELRDLLQALCDSVETVDFYRQHAEEYITQRYNWDEVTQKTLELYQ